MHLLVVLLLLILIITPRTHISSHRIYEHFKIRSIPPCHRIGTRARWSFINGYVNLDNAVQFRWNEHHPVYNNQRMIRPEGRDRRKFQLRGSLNDYIYKLLIRRFKKVTYQGERNIYKSLLSAKSSYNIDFLFSCNYSLSDIKKKLAEYIYELKFVDGDEFKIVYLGKRRLVRPIKKQDEAYYILFTFQIYPSMIYEISKKLRLQDPVLRFMITKNEKKTRNLEYMENEPIKEGLASTEAHFFKKLS
ncbi:30S ribosomal protein S6 [Plasmodium gonderi]|uniref:30S ribosomal protein S6 n=1 Tax=Plasmodium gonderi TaxID=77519 RepID=A0A1Y1JCZ0_PLAGO|nr:30S ribosomal protein S6 [Plasmodium gonderi]GAW80391.1 30S ribosomal protein S6 [Plasmodium gonderi]